MNAAIARVTEVPARDAVGGNEPSHFTPWLAHNIDVLGDVLGMSLRVLGDGETVLEHGKHIEVGVGSYSLDIRATDSAGRVVAIENQYGRGDHSHLGQLITYAAGVGADALVWVAEAFSDDHLQSIRWLNERTDGECGLYAVRARFVRIGSSDVAPVFEVLVAPSRAARRHHEFVASKEVWTQETFLDAFADPDERAAVQKTLALALESAVPGAREPIWYGSRPNGWVYIHPEGTERAAFMLWRNSKGRAMVNGAWKAYDDVRAHPAYAHVAAVLGQNHADGKATGRALRELDLDILWQAALATARELRLAPASEGSTQAG